MTTKPLPKSVDFPGSIRFLDRGPKDGPQVKTTRVLNEDGTFQANRVVIPPGLDVTYTQQPGEGTEKPTFLLTVKPTPAPHSPTRPPLPAPTGPDDITRDPPPVAPPPPATHADAALPADVVVRHG